MLKPKHPGIDIRPVTVTDAPVVLACLQRIDATAPYLLYQPGERNWDVDTTAMVIDQSSQSGVFFGAFADQQMCGYLLLQGSTLQKIQHSAQIVVAVDATYRHQGIGQRLLTTALEYAQDQGLHRLELSVIPENTVAKHLYEKLGFTVEGIKKQAIQQSDGFADEMIMAKLLK